MVFAGKLAVVFSKESRIHNFAQSISHDLGDGKLRNECLFHCKYLE